MARTYRRCNWDEWHWKSSHQCDFRNSQIEAHDGYEPRVRHKCYKWPHLISTYDDKFPASLSDNWNTGKNKKGEKIHKKELEE